MSLVGEKHSEYFVRSLTGMRARGLDPVPILNERAAHPVDKMALRDWYEAADTAASVEIRLRRLRQWVMLTLIERDLRGAASLDEVCRAMTALAEFATAEAIHQASDELRDQFGMPRDADGAPIDLMAIGMGKAGAHELNVSSDLDLVFLIRCEGETDGLDRHGQSSRRSPLSASEFAHRVARRVITILADVTADGFVFRVDTRLRPNGDSGPLVCSFPALETYFQAQGREWERFAWLKGRVIAEGPFAGLAQLQADRMTLDMIVEPFVFRRYLDYEIFQALRELHAMIRQEARKRDARRAEGLDVKLGRGGIREIEFVAQLFQIVRGGRDHGLRDRATLVTLAALSERGLLAPDEADALSEAYVFLRRLEHMIQYRQDQQTHFLPANPAERARIAGMMAMSASAFDERLGKTVQVVEQVFDALLSPEGSQTTPPEGNGPSMRPIDGDEDVGQAHEQAQDQAEVERHFESLLGGSRYHAARPSAQQAIRSLLGQARRQGINAAGALRLTRLLEAICRRPAYLALLAEFPLAFERVLQMLEASEWAADYLTRHPVLLDELIDGNLFVGTDFAAWQQDLSQEIALARLGDAPDTERQMDIARESHHAQFFRVLARELGGLLTVERVSDELSEIADRVLAVAMDTVWSQLKQRFRDSPRFAAIAYGRLGGRELGYASDLDLVFLFDDDDPNALEAYSKLAQRVSTWLSARTAAGQLFEIDLRLRPNGEAGMLVSSIRGFESYQRESAWVWEHQALTRARFCAGDASVGQWFEHFRRELLAEPRELEALATSIREMRQKMHDGHPNRSTKFDLKHDSGGMVDIEFIVQFLVLGHAHQHPELLDNVGNIALLGRAAQAGLIEVRLAAQVADAYREYRRWQHALRMGGAQYARLDHERVSRQREAVRDLWDRLLVGP
ncbi:MAG: bifunctional [glutamate--ammonia ligase]-adenylyl-L-tyrosine phosphorylase/[glutamate--ammonia-ligase] adenylyltransferase [Burkholderiaceae bacterium]